MSSCTKKAVMYGGGNIGRGFIAQLFYMSGFETVFIDVNEELVGNINTAHEYPIFITRENEYERFDVKNVRAVNGRDADAVAREIADADVLATAVGVNILKFIAAPVAAGIKLRKDTTGKPLNIIICENLIDADIYFRSLIDNELSDEYKAYFKDSVGLIEASIGRMVPATPDNIKAEYPLAVCVEPYCTLPVNSAAIVGEFPEIANCKPDAPFELYIQRKLFMHNMSHAVTAYLGYIAGYTYIWEAAADARIRYVALAALVEAATALAAEHKIDSAPLIEHAFDLLSRFDNKLLGDTIERVGRDTKRKLSSGDRIVGIIKLCRKHNLPCEFITAGLAAGLMFAPESDDSSKEIEAFVKANGITAALKQYSELEDADVIKAVERRYTELVLNKTVKL